MARDPQRFSAERGGVVLEDLPPESLEMMRAMLLAMDPPRHVAYRKPLADTFKAKVIAELEGQIRAICRDLMAEAAAAAEGVGIGRLRLLRPPWRPVDGDRWHRVPHIVSAAAELRALGAERVLVTTGRLELAPFAGLAGMYLVTRSIEPPDPMVLPGATVVLDRGPFDVDGELALLCQHGIDTLVAKDSGGVATAPKLEAARRLGIRVVLVDRPPAPPGPAAGTPSEAIAWIDGQLRRGTLGGVSRLP